MQAEMEPEIKKRVNKMLANISEEFTAMYHNEITFNLHHSKDFRLEIRIVSAYTHPDWSTG